ncbi:class I SAM-dependent methyltransferase [Ottowia sp.]|uniref:class I SAM-dependent methyltransferase n=1 Tax=Ottowia sp. TaxID=1898956 RepID=UPI003A83C14A
MTEWQRINGGQGAERVARALELGAGAQSSLAPLLLPLAQRVECSAYDAVMLPAVRTRNAALLPVDEHARIVYTRQDAHQLQGQWDVIVLKSVLGGLHRVHHSTLADVHATLVQLMQHLSPGGWLVTLDNGVSAVAPLLARLGARRNGWRLLRRGDLPAPAFYASYGVLSSFSAATRLGAAGAAIDDALYVADRVLTPLARQHAVHLHAYRQGTVA